MHAWLLLDIMILHIDFGTMTSFPHNLLLINNLLFWDHKGITGEYECKYFPSQQCFYFMILKSLWLSAEQGKFHSSCDLPERHTAILWAENSVEVPH